MWKLILVEYLWSNWNKIPNVTWHQQFHVRERCWQAMVSYAVLLQTRKRKVHVSYFTFRASATNTRRLQSPIGPVDPFVRPPPASGPSGSSSTTTPMLLPSPLSEKSSVIPKYWNLAWTDIWFLLSRYEFGDIYRTKVFCRYWRYWFCWYGKILPIWWCISDTLPILLILSITWISVILMSPIFTLWWDIAHLRQK